MAEDDGEIDLDSIGPIAARDAASIRERAERDGLAKVDGRTRRRVNRTEAMTFRFSPEIRETILRLADADGLTFVLVVEEAVRLLDQTRRGAARGR